MTTQLLEKRKLPRFHITPCQFQDEALNKTFSVQDISLGGLAIRLIDRADIPEFSVGSEHQGTIKLEGVKSSCSFKIKYLRGTLVGAEWVNLPEAFQKHLGNLSHPKNLGENLRAYDLPEVANTVWYHNPIGVDLLLSNSQGGGATSQGFSRWTLYIHHSFVQWELDSGIKTGQAVAEDEEGYAHGIVRLETRLIDYNETVDRRLLETAIELIEHAPIKDAALKTMLMSQLKSI